MIWLHPTPKIRRWFLGIIVLAVLAPSAGWGDPMGARSAANDADHRAADRSDRQGGKSNRHADKSDQPGSADPRRHKGGAPTSARNSTSKTSLEDRRRAAATETSAGARALATAGLPARFIPSAVSPSPVATVSGNAVARHTSVSTAVGGPITYDAKHAALVIIGGTAMNRAPHYRTGEP